MTKVDKLQIRYVNMYEDREIPISWLIRIWNSDEVFFIFHPSNNAYVANLDEWEKFQLQELRNKWKILYPIHTFLWLKIWLIDVINAKEWRVLEYNRRLDGDWISIQYIKIDNEIWKLRIEFDDSFPRFEDPFFSEEPIEWVVSKFELINLVYGWFVDYLAENFNWKEWFENVFWISEPIYETFFSYDIDKYLKENWVDDIDERVQKAKHKIREEWNNLFDECDKEYKGNHDPYWHTFEHLI